MLEKRAVSFSSRDASSEHTCHTVDSSASCQGEESLQGRVLYDGNEGCTLSRIIGRRVFEGSSDKATVDSVWPLRAVGIHRHNGRAALLWVKAP